MTLTSIAIPESFDATQYKVLCVDDEPNILSALRRMLSLEGFQVLTADSGASALGLLEKESIDIIISDMQMPQMNGAELLKTVREKWPKTMRLMLTGASDISGAIHAINEGEIYRYTAKPWNDEELLGTIKAAISFALLANEHDRLDALTQAQKESLNEMVDTLESRVQERTKDLRAAYVASIKAFSNLLELRRADLMPHSRRVANLSMKMAKLAGLNDDECQSVFIAGLLHDVGKIGLSDRVLNTKFIELPLADAKVYRTHCAMGEATLNTLHDMQGVAAIIRSHHEYFNGTGFPDSLSGTDIPIGARIVAIVEAYEELISGDYAKVASSPADAVRVIISNKGKLFCPEMTDLFVKAMRS
jgi:response regulator RpfG family c-di-GMP phosphodiesterase